MTWCIVVVYWLVGLTVALVAGHFAAKSVVDWLRSRIVLAHAADKEPYKPLWLSDIGIPVGMTGFIERLFFTTAVAFELSGVATAMIAWIVVKLAADWNRPTTPADPAGTLSAALGSLVSMLFALAGGMICRSWRA
jgi:hypothetical protein